MLIKLGILLYHNPKALRISKLLFFISYLQSSTYITATSISIKLKNKFELQDLFTSQMLSVMSQHHANYWLTLCHLLADTLDCKLFYNLGKFEQSNNFDHLVSRFSIIQLFLCKCMLPCLYIWYLGVMAILTSLSPFLSLMILQNPFGIT